MQALGIATMGLFMLGRLLHLAVLLFVSLWFGVIAPGHTRGTIKLGGMSPGHCSVALTAAPSTDCCELMGDAGESGESRPEAPVDPASCCAVCYLNSVLNPPAPPPTVTVLTWMLAKLEPVEPAAMASIHITAAIDIRGPPSLA